MQLELTAIEAQLLLRHLERHIQHLETELVPTDQHELQQVLARDIEVLREICEKLRSDPQQVLPDLV